MTTNRRVPRLALKTGVDDGPLTAMPRIRSWAMPMVVGLALSAAAASAQTVSTFGFAPPIVSVTGPAQVLFTAHVPDPVTRVVFSAQPGFVGPTTDTEMRDDGTGGDAVAGDRVYSVQLSTAPFIAALRTDDVFRVFAGFLDLYNGTTRTLRVNTFLDVYSPSLGSFPTLQLTPTMQATSHLVNIVSSVAPGDDLRPLVRQFYQVLGDDYDFINLVFTPTRAANRDHITVKNAVTGIGKALSDNTAQYGSAGRLKGLNRFPVPTLFDGATTGYVHELGHLWINFVNLAPFAQGLPHWPYSSMGGGVMGISIPPTNQGGSFGCDVVDENGQVRLNPRSGAPLFNPLDLYLMGLARADEVPTQIVFNDQNAARQLTCSGQLFVGAVTRVSAQDVVAGVGPRVPAAGEAQSGFRIATILVTPGGFASPELMSLYTFFAARAESRVSLPAHEGFAKYVGNPFFVATRGRGTLDAQLTLPAPAAPLGFRAATTSGNTVTFEWLQPGTGVAATSYVLEGGVTPGSNLGRLEFGSGANSASLELPTGTFFVRLYAVAGPVRSAASNEIQISVNVPAPPQAPNNLLGLVDGTSLTLAWQNAVNGLPATGNVLDVTGPITTSLNLPASERFQYPRVPAGTFTFAVRTANANGTSPPSNAVTLTFPSACSGVPGVPASFFARREGHTIVLSWNLPPTGPAPSGYVVSVSGAVNASLPMTTRRIAGAVGPGSYTLSVHATNACGSSPPTAPQTVVVP